MGPLFSPSQTTKTKPTDGTCRGANVGRPDDPGHRHRAGDHKGRPYRLAKWSSNWSMESLPVTSSENPTKEKP